MNKLNLVDAIASQADISKSLSNKVLDITIASIKDALANGEVVSIVNFGSFNVKKRAARVGRNPQTGEAIQIEAANVPVFKAGKALKNAVAKVEITTEA